MFLLLHRLKPKISLWLLASRKEVGCLFLCANNPQSLTAAVTGSKSYMLRSCLDPLIIEHAAQTHGTILEEEGSDQAVFFPSTLDEDEDDRDEDAERPPKFYGSLISWSRGDQLGCIGILYVILALVLTNGKVMADGKSSYFRG